MLVITLKQTHGVMTDPFPHLKLSALRPQGGMRLWAEPNENITQLSSVVEKWIVQEGWSFSCQGIDLAPEEMSAPDGLLPLVLHQAQDCMARATGSTMPHIVVHEESDSGLCGVSVSQVKGMSLAQWILAASFALEERVKQHGKPGPVPVDMWYEGWQKSYDLGLVDVRRAPTQPQPQIPSSVRS
jgi:hypothetical protein